MSKYTLILILAISSCTLVNASIKICVPIKKQTNAEESYSILMENVKEKVVSLLSDSSSVVEHVEFDFHHPALSLKGELNNVTVEHRDEYDFEYFQVDEITKDFDVFKLTFRNISTEGEYNLTGNIGDLFDIFGVGHFWANPRNFSIIGSAKLLSLNLTAICLSFEVNVKLESIEAWFYDLMGDAELEDLINKTLIGIAPEIIEVIWDEFKDALDGPLQEWIDSILYGTFISINSSPIEAEDIILRNNK